MTEPLTYRLDLPQHLQHLLEAQDDPHSSPHTCIAAVANVNESANE